MEAQLTDAQRVEEIGVALLRRHRPIGESMARRIREEIPDYAAAGGEVLADLESLAVETARLLSRMLAGEIPGDRDDLAGIRRRVARRVHQGIGLEPFLHAYRIAQGEYWEACSREAVTARLPAEASLALGSRLHEVMDTLTAHAAESYMREEMRVGRRSGRALRDLVERLIAGRGGEVGRRPTASPGFDLDARLLVAVARVAAGAGSVDDRLESFRSEVERSALSLGIRPLVALRQGELVVVAPGDDWSGAVRKSLEAARAGSGEGSGDDIRIGLGGPGAGGESVARSYRDALSALSYASGSRPVLALAELGSLQSALANADLATRQVIASHAARFAGLPAATQASIAETVRAFAAASLNVTAAADAIGLHPNTLRYRLERIAEQTGYDPRDVIGLIELVCILESDAPGSV
jgi:PucR C-terminal helix-turn-helix domain/GGDEF-like domain